MKEFSEEEREKIQDKYNKDLLRLSEFFLSMDYDLEDVKILTTLFLSMLCASEKFDEEDMRDIFRGVSSLKDRIRFK